MGHFSGWGWNYAGKVKLEEGPVEVVLEDLTGLPLTSKIT